MKSFSIFVLSLCVTVSYGGVVPWTKDGEDEALSLWREYCSGSSDSGTDESGDVDWFCKKSKEEGRIVVHPHKIDLDLKPENKKQIVFIETPADHFRHDITVSGRVDADHKTNIVVIPAKDTHEFNVKKDISVNVDGGKPAIFFVRNDQTENVDSVGAAPPGYPPKQPPPPDALYPVHVDGTKPQIFFVKNDQNAELNSTIVSAQPRIQRETPKSKIRVAKRKVLIKS